MHLLWINISGQVRGLTFTGVEAKGRKIFFFLLDFFEAASTGVGREQRRGCRGLCTVHQLQVGLAVIFALCQLLLCGCSPA